MRDRVLMALAVNQRPLYIEEICRLVDSDSRKVRNTLQALLRCGLIVRDSKPTGACYIGLNTGYPAYRQLLLFLRKLEEQYPQDRVGKPQRRAERLRLRNVLLQPVDYLSVQQTDSLFYSTIRSRVLLGIASIEDTDVSDLVKTFSLDSRSCWNAVNHWQREGIIKSVVRGRRRALELDPVYQAHNELRLFLKRLVAVTREYEILAEFSTRKIGGAKFVSAR